MTNQWRPSWPTSGDGSGRLTNALCELRLGCSLQTAGYQYMNNNSSSHGPLSRINVSDWSPFPMSMPANTHSTNKHNTTTHFTAVKFQFTLHYICKLLCKYVKRQRLRTCSSVQSGRCSATTTIRSSFNTVTENTTILHMPRSSRCD